MTCAAVRERLLLYASGELAAPQSARLLRHLERCSACAVLLDKAEETQVQVNAALSTAIEAPATLDARVMDAVRQVPVRRRWDVLLVGWERRRRLTLAAAALCLVGLGFGVGRWAGTGAPGPSEAAVLDLPLLGAAYQRSSAEPLARAAEEPAPGDLSRLLTHQMRFPVKAVDLNPEGARLIGGGWEEVQGVPVAYLVYFYMGKRVTLFQMEGRKLTPPALQEPVFGPDSYLVKKIGGFTYVAWRSKGTNNVMVADAVPMHHLFRLGCHACEKQERL